MACRILVVDDDVVVSIWLSFSDEDVEVTDAPRIDGALRTAVDGAFDAAVIDRRLPDGDGLELVRQLRAHPATADLPIIVLTAGFDEADRDEVLQAGAHEYLSKSMEPSSLVAAVKDLVAPPVDGAATEGEEPPSGRKRRGRRRRAVPPRSGADTLPTLPLPPPPRPATGEPTERRRRIDIDSTPTLDGQVTALRAELEAARSSLSALETAVAELELRLAQSEAANAALVAEAERRSAQAVLDLREGARRLLERTRAQR